MGDNEGRPALSRRKRRPREGRIWGTEGRPRHAGPKRRTEVEDEHQELPEMRQDPLLLGGLVPELPLRLPESTDDMGSTRSVGSSPGRCSWAGCHACAPGRGRPIEGGSTTSSASPFYPDESAGHRNLVDAAATAHASAHVRPARSRGLAGLDSAPAGSTADVRRCLRAGFDCLRTGSAGGFAASRSRAFGRFGRSHFPDAGAADHPFIHLAAFQFEPARCGSQPAGTAAAGLAAGRGPVEPARQSTLETTVASTSS
jgi:hypothetical protein